MKRCPRCETPKEMNQFSADRCKADGKQTYCVMCQKEIRRERRAKIKTTGQQWRINNRDRARELCREYYSRHREAQLNRMRQWRIDNPGAAYKAVRSWQLRNWDKVLAYSQNRRSRKLSAEGSFTGAEWMEKCAAYDNKCAYCDKPKPLTIQHVVPLSKGGSNYIENIVPACKTCNSRIHDKIVYPPVKELQLS